MWEKSKTPCKGCEERREACWDSCERYKAYKEADTAKKKALTEWVRESYRDRMDTEQKKFGREQARKHGKK